MFYVVEMNGEQNAQHLLFKNVLLPHLQMYYHHVVAAYKSQEEVYFWICFPMDTMIMVQTDCFYININR